MILTVKTKHFNKSFMMRAVIPGQELRLRIASLTQPVDLDGVEVVVNVQQRLDKALGLPSYHVNLLPCRVDGTIVIVKIPKDFLDVS